MSKTYNSRIQQKHDTATNWEKAINFVPLSGEIIIYDPEYSETGQIINPTRLKIGDGDTNVNSLPFVADNVAGDVGQKTTEGGEIFSDYETNFAFAEKTIVSGVNSHAGAKGYYWHWYNNNTIQLCDQDGGQANPNGWNVGDFLYFIFDGKARGNGKLAISNIADNLITLKEASSLFTPEELAKTWDNGNSSYMVWNNNHPNEGDYMIVSAPDLIGAEAHGLDNTALGKYSSANGRRTIAQGHYSHTEGSYSKATGENAHAEGYDSLASGKNSHTEGQSTKATNTYAHAEGFNNVASGKASHAEGQSTTASGHYSHTEGTGTKAIGEHSHAEGYNSESTGKYAHSEGHQAKASGEASHAEGSSTASGQASHAEGSGVASGQASHAEGSYTQATHSYSHAEGQASKAFNENAHAEGQGSTASGLTSHAEGHNTTASGGYSHSEGYTSNATNSAAHAEGYNTEASGAYGSHSEGRNTLAKGQSSHAEGDSTKATGQFAHSEGYKTSASRDSAHAEGDSTVAIAMASHAEGWGTKTADSAMNDHKGQHVQGRFNIISNKYAHILGNGTVDESGVEKRSNAHTVDWNGNGWFAGNVKVGGTGQDDKNAKILATQEYIDNKLIPIDINKIGGINDYIIQQGFVNDWLYRLYASSVAECFLALEISPDEVMNLQYENVFILPFFFTEQPYIMPSINSYYVKVNNIYSEALVDSNLGAIFISVSFDEETGLMPNGPISITLHCVGHYCELIDFTLGGNTTKARKDMTWYDWCLTDMFNTSGQYSIQDDKLKYDGYQVYNSEGQAVMSNDLIVAGGNYSHDINLNFYGYNYKANTTMTWSEWVNSDLSNSPDETDAIDYFDIDDENKVTWFFEDSYVDEEGYDYWSTAKGYIVDELDNPVYANDLIKALNYSTYETYSDIGGGPDYIG